MKRFFSNTIVILFLAITTGILIGHFSNEQFIRIVLSVKQISGQVIFFLVPLIILGFVAPSIALLKGNVSKLLGFAFLIAYLSSFGAAVFAAFTGFNVIPLLDIQPLSGGLKPLPENLFILNIPPVMSVMTALLLSVFIGLGTIWIKSKHITPVLVEFQNIVIQLVKRIMLPVLPLFVGVSFCILSYEGRIGALKVFLPVILIVIVSHYLWITFLYLIAAVYSGKNSWTELKNYFPAYFTALGTMSSAATLGVTLNCARKSKELDKDVSDFSIPLFANIHLCGSVLTEVFFVCVVSQILYGHLPDIYTLGLFITLLCVFAIGAPGVPGGTVLASLGIVISVLGFDEAGTAFLIAIFALQDSFGTACNVTGGGATALIVDTYIKKKMNVVCREPLIINAGFN